MIQYHKSSKLTVCKQLNFIFVVKIHREYKTNQGDKLYFVKKNIYLLNTLVELFYTWVLFVLVFEWFSWKHMYLILIFRPDNMQVPLLKNSVSAWIWSTLKEMLHIPAVKCECLTNLHSFNQISLFMSDQIWKNTLKVESFT